MNRLKLAQLIESRITRRIWQTSKKTGQSAPFRRIALAICAGTALTMFCLPKTADSGEGFTAKFASSAIAIRSAIHAARFDFERVAVAYPNHQQDACADHSQGGTAVSTVIPALLATVPTKDEGIWTRRGRQTSRGLHPRENAIKADLRAVNRREIPRSISAAGSPEGCVPDWSEIP